MLAINVSIYEIYYIWNIIVILLCCNLTITIIYCATHTHTHIYRKCWLINWLSLPIILNLVSEPSVIKTLLLLSLLVVGLISPSPKWTLLLLLQPTPPTKMAVQPNQLATQKLLPLVPSPISSRPNLQSRTMALSLMFLPSLFTSWGQRLLPLLRCPTLIKWSRWSLQLQSISIDDADEAISSWSRCFPLCRWLSVVSSLSCFWLFWWFFFSNQPFFSPLEATWSTYFKRVTLLPLHGRPTSCGRLLDFFLYLAHSWENARFFIKFSYYATPWVFSRSSARRCFGYYIYVARQVIIWWIGCCWPAPLSWRLQPLYILWPSWWV
jgi:hypothetical protein